MCSSCAASVTLAIQHLPEMAAERGIQACLQLGDFGAALALCERAVALDVGAHYEAKRDSLSWVADT